MRIAAIDIGTNSIHMVIADATLTGGFEVVDREREVVQIGRDSFVSSRLTKAAIRRCVDALQRFVQLARRHQVDRILCTATAAVREARNGGEFIAAARQASGVTPRVIPAAEEGRLIYLAVKSALALEEKPALIVDIGGGSMQLVVGNRERCLQALSTPLGALRLSETVLRSDPPGRRDLARLNRLIRKTLRDPLETVNDLEPVRVYGSSGSIHALAHITHWAETGQPIEHINGHVLSLESLRRMARRLQRMTIVERERLPGLDAMRAEIIIPGALVLAHVLREVGADGITISDYGVREGLVTDFIASHGQEITALGHVEDLRLRSVLQCLAKFDHGSEHPFHVARLALELFDGLKSFHSLGPAERELLHFAALLHDVGAVIGHDGHAEHSYYIIKNANLRGLTAAELDLIANVARYHGKARPRKRDKNYRSLPAPERRIIRWLSAMLRIAEGLDRSQYQLIRSLRVSRLRGRAVIHVALSSARDAAQLEVWAARERTDLLERMLGVPVVLAPEKLRERARRTERRVPPRSRTKETIARLSRGRAAKRLRVVKIPAAARSGG